MTLLFQGGEFSQIEFRRTIRAAAHFTGAHASRLTMRTKLWLLFQAIRLLVVREGPMVRIRLPPAASLLRTCRVYRQRQQTINAEKATVPVPIYFLNFFCQ
jgi:hypothetical protein